MANWSNPILTSLYLDVLNDLKSRDVDAITMNAVVGTNLPNTSMRLNRANNSFEEWNGVGWNTRVLSVVGGGTGSSTPAGAITNLGLGTMASQNANAVNITGGTFNGGVVVANSSLTVGGCLIGQSGQLTMYAQVVPASDNAYNIGSNALRFARLYLKSSIVIPVGTNMYATG